MRKTELLTKRITFTSCDKKLPGIFFYPTVQKRKYSAILFINGGGNKKKTNYSYAKALSRYGFLCFLFDMRSYDENRNVLRNKDFLDDALKAYDVLYSADKVDIDNMSIFGTSFGGYLAALLSSKRKIKQMVLRVPADYPDMFFEKSIALSSGRNPIVKQWRKKVKKYTESKALEAVHNFNRDILIIESELDEKIPHQTIENYINSIDDKKKLTYFLMKGALHNSKENTFKKEVEKILGEWFKRRM